MLNQVTVAVRPITITIWYTNKMATIPDIKAIIRTIRADPNITSNGGDEGITFVSRSNKPDTNKKTTTIMERKRGLGVVIRGLKKLLMINTQLGK